MEKWFEINKCPLGVMINTWGERLGLEEWAIREAAEEYYKENKDKDVEGIDISWDVLSRAEAKRPVIIKNEIKKSDPELRIEINRLRGVIANLREAIADLSADKEEMWVKVEVLESRATRAENDVKELRKDNLAFSGDLEDLGASVLDKFDTVESEMEKIRLATELDKLETESNDLKAEVKGKRRFWQRNKNV